MTVKELSYFVALTVPCQSNKYYLFKAAHELLLSLSIIAGTHSCQPEYLSLRKKRLFAMVPMNIVYWSSATCGPIKNIKKKKTLRPDTLDVR